MMDESLSELYQEVILDHSKKPHNFRKLEAANRSAEGFNPLCGDQITLYLNLENDLIQEISFQGSGCAISKASASLMTTMLKTKTKAQATELFQKFQQMVTGQDHNKCDSDALGKLTVFRGVRDYPVRVKCATLAWHTLRAALEEKKITVTTEGEMETTPSLNPLLIESQVIEALRSCYDPEIPVNIYEMGLIYDIQVEPSGNVSIRMTLTSPMCPVAESLPPEVERKVKNVPGVTDAQVEVVWEPPWTPDKMSEAAKLQLGM